MSEYDIIFFTHDELNQSASSNFCYQPSDPIHPSAAIGDAQTQAFDFGKSLVQSSMPETMGTYQVEYDQQLFHSSVNLIQLPTQRPTTPPTSPVTESSAQSWADLFPELFPQSFWHFDDQHKWNEQIRWEMAQPGYPTHPGRFFGANYLGWNLQATRASHDVLPICSEEHHQSEGPLGSVGYWDSVQQKVTLKGWEYKSPVQYPTVPALIVTQPEGFIDVLVPHSLVPTPRSAYDGDDVWWWIQDWLNMPLLEDEASMYEMNESAIAEASDEGIRKRKRED